jgi:hypothetical protein
VIAISQTGGLNHAAISRLSLHFLNAIHGPAEIVLIWTFERLRFFSRLSSCKHVVRYVGERVFVSVQLIWAGSRIVHFLLSCSPSRIIHAML